MGLCRTCVSGAVGIAKAAAQATGIPVDKAPADVVSARRSACRTCSMATRSLRVGGSPHWGLNKMSVCGGCGCLIVAKTMIASASCPLRFWLPVLTSPVREKA